MHLFSKLIAFCCLPFFTLAQHGKIIQISDETKPGEPLPFRYTPPPGLQIPDDARVKVLYMPYAQKKAAMKKESEGFRFTLTLPDTFGVFVAAVFDAKNNVLDNNAGKGYTVEVDLNTPDKSAANAVAPLQLAWAGNFSLGLKNTATDIIKG